MLTPYGFAAAIRERLAALAQVEPGAGREVVAVEAFGRARLPDGHERVRILERERLEEDAVDRAEHRCCRHRCRGLT